MGQESELHPGTHRGKSGIVEAAVFQKTVDFPDESAHGFHVSLDDGAWVTVRREQVAQIRS